MDEELKKALLAAKAAHEEYKAGLFAAEVERTKMGRVSAELQAKLERIESDMDAKVAAAQARYDALETRINRGELFGGAGDKRQALDLEASAFNSYLMNPKDRGFNDNRRPFTVEGYKVYKKAFVAWMRSGNSVLDQNPDFRAALSVASDPEGGYLVPADITSDVVKLITESSPIRQVARVVQTSRDEIELKRDLDVGVSGGWVGEKATRSATNTPQVPVPVKMPIHEQYAFPLATQKELDDADSDVERWLIDETAAQITRDENTAFFSGTGVMKPRGFLTYTAGTPSKAAFERIEQVATGGSGAFATAPNGPDIFLDMIGKLKEGLVNSAWLMSRATLATARKLKDSYGGYQTVQFGLGLTSRPGFTILGDPVVLCADMPAIASNSLSIACGDWKRGYKIADHRTGLRVLRDPYTQKPYVGFYIIKRVGGDVENFEAIKLAKFATS